MSAVWRVITLAALLGTPALAGGGPRVATSVLLAGASCQPYIGRVTFGVTPDAGASREMARIVALDQAARQTERIDWAVVAREDEARRAQTLALLRAGRLSSAADYFDAALVFQHGNCPQHYQLAHLLAGQALARGALASGGALPAGWLFAATFDRWQLSLGRPQAYGTQFSNTPGQCEWRLTPVDAVTTDAQRERLGVPALGLARAQADIMNARCRGDLP